MSLSHTPSPAAMEAATQLVPMSNNPNRSHASAMHIAKVIDDAMAEERIIAAKLSRALQDIELFALSNEWFELNGTAVRMTVADKARSAMMLTQEVHA